MEDGRGVGFDAEQITFLGHDESLPDVGRLSRQLPIPAHGAQVITREGGGRREDESAIRIGRDVADAAEGDGVRGQISRAKLLGDDLAAELDLDEIVAVFTNVI